MFIDPPPVSPCPIVSENDSGQSVDLYHNCLPRGELLTLGRWHKRWGFQRMSSMLGALGPHNEDRWVKVEPMSKCPGCEAPFDWQPTKDYIGLKLEWSC